MNWLLFSPELHCLLMAGVFLVLSLLEASPRRDYWTAVILSAVVLGFCLLAVTARGDLFAATYRVDLFSQIYKLLLGAGLFLTLCISSELKGIPRRWHSEYYLLLTVSTLAMMMLVSAVHLVTVFVALELSSYSLYILVALSRGRGYGLAEGIKYFLVGACASAIMLFGMALLYGASGEFYLAGLMEALPAMLSRPEVVIGLFLTLAGFFFKLALFPFHFWAPGAYGAAANQVAAFIATVSKVAAVALLTRFVALSAGQSPYLVEILAVLAIVSMTVGNLAAVVQTDLKRLLAYSSVAHAGYVLLGILAASAWGYAAVLFYAVGLLVMKFTCFFVLVKAAPDGRNLQVAELAGLHQRAPILAMALMLALFGLAGIPPTIGFTGKLLVFTAAIQQGHLILVIIAMVNVVISLYYYLRVLKAAYLKEPEDPLPALNISPAANVLALLLMGIMIGVGIAPNLFIELTREAVRGLG
ncbi:MAG: NADH-quinone oxidoreductase subunit N [Desulfobacterales bacterium]